MTREQFVDACEHLDILRDVSTDVTGAKLLLDQLEEMYAESMLTHLKSLNGRSKTPTLDEVECGTSRGRIPTIKMYRQRTGAGLKEAKDAIEDHFRNNNLTFGTTW
jgi:ribosomal protein L7/L12